MDDQTLLIAHVDTKKLDLVALQKFVNELMDAAKFDEPSRKNLTPMWVLAQGYLTQLEQAGARHIYAIVSHPDAWPKLEPVAILLPVEPGGNPKNLIAALKLMLPKDVKIAELGQNLIYVGQHAPLARMQTMKPSRRPDLEAGMAVTEGGVFQAVVAPTADVRRAISELLPRLPAQFINDPQEASTEFFTQGLKTITVKIDLPPEARVTLTLESNTASDAEKTGRFLVRLQKLADELAVAEHAPAIARDLIASLKPATEKTSTRIMLDQKTMKDTATTLAPVVLEARAQAQRVQSAAQIRQIIMVASQYADRHQDQWPESLAVLEKDKLVTPQLLIHPADPERRRYEYRHWTKDQMKKLDAGLTPVVWEVMGESGGNVGFLDWHVEFVKAARFAELLKAAEAAAAK